LVKKGNVSLESARFDEKIFRRIVKQENVGLGLKDSKSLGKGIGRGKGKEGLGGDMGIIKEWKYDRKQVEGFRYRMEDALRSVTKASIKEARIKEIKQEILNSEKLKVSAPFFFSLF